MKICPVLCKYSYGDKSRGYSLGYEGFYAAFKKISKHVEPFWFDDFLSDPQELQRQTIQAVERINPDVVFFVLMNDEFSLETLDYLKQKYLTINWFGDDTWRFESFATHYADHFSVAVTTDKYAVAKYKTSGHDNVVLSQWASYGQLDRLDISNNHYQYNVSFVGAYSGYRQWVVKELHKRGIEVDCFGHGWPKGVVSFEKMAEIFATSRINLNISNSVSYDLRCVIASKMGAREFLGATLKGARKTAEQIKARNFEIPAYGGFQLTNYVPSLEDYFVLGEEIAAYASIDDCALQIDYYVAHPKDRQKILQAGYDRSRHQHLYVHRFKEMFHNMRKVL